MLLNVPGNVMTPLLPINWAVLLLMSRKFFIEKLKVRKTFWLLKDEEYWNRVSSLLLLKEEFKCFVITRLPREARPEPEASPACFPEKPQITSNVFYLLCKSDSDYLSQSCGVVAGAPFQLKLRLASPPPFDAVHFIQCDAVKCRIMQIEI